MWSITKLRVLLVVGGVLCSLTTGAQDALCQTAQSVSVLPSAMQPLADQYLKPGQTPASASDAMDQMAAQMTPELAEQLAPLEGRDIRTKLALIAWDRRRHPEIYQELDTRYLRSVGGLPGGHVQQSPGVSPEHATEKYRLAWEYLLLTPVTGRPSDLWNLRVLDALDEIKDNASLLTLKQALAATTAPGMRSDQNRNWQQTLLGEMAVWQNAQGLQAILDSMALIQQQQAHASKGDQIWDVAKDVRENDLAPMFNPKENAKWRDIIAAFPKAGLTAYQKSFLTSVLAAIATNPPMAPGMTPEIMANP